MASKTYIQHFVDRPPALMLRSKPQGRTPSWDAKVVVPLRLRPSTLARIAERGQKPQEFIEHLVLQELLKS